MRTIHMEGAGMNAGGALTLYYKPTCPYSQRMLAAAEDMGVKLHLKNIADDPLLVDEMIAKGGKKQTPFLEDTRRDVCMYESGDIISYLQTHYNKSNVAGAGGVCESCQ